MALILRWLLRAALALIAAGAVGLALSWYLVARSLPQHDGTIAVAGLEAPVEVIRDANAVPHIRAASDRDAFFALGLVHAQDRLWQMELNRRAAQGRLSAMFGARTLGLDRLVKTLNLYGYASAALKHQTPETRAALEAYAEGVNAWIRHVQAEALGRGAPEFFVFGHALSPWTPADSLAVLKMMALRLTNAARTEVRRARFLLHLPPERVADILPDYPNAATTTPPRYSALFPGARFADAAPPSLGSAGQGEAFDWALAAFGPPARPDRAGASNIWAVDGTRSASGRPLLASDPHLWLSAPSLWYLADIQGPGIAAIGGTLPGTPAVLIGRNRDIAWGLATTNADDQDLFIEKLNPEDPDEYLTPQGWRRFETRAVRIEVAGEAPVTHVARATRHGPVLSDNQFGVDAVTPEGHVAALGWTALDERDTSMSAILGMMRAGSLNEGLTATELALAPAQNVVLADREGIALTVAGALPVRGPESRAQGRLPSPGWLTVNDWQGLQDRSRNPRIVRPATGAVANANNRITDAPYPNHVSFDWDTPYRIQRLEKELKARAFHSRDGFVALQNDAVSEMARSVLPLIARDLWWGREEEPGAPPQRAEALALLADWTGEMDAHGSEGLIFAAWMRALTRRLAADELGPLFEEVEGAQPLFVERVFRDIDGASAWCNVDKTPEAETCAEMARLALADALAELERDHGRSVDGWRWGRAHRAEHPHLPFGSFGPLGLLFSLEQETSGGDHTLLRGATPGFGPRPYRNVHAAGLKVVVDFADPDRSVMMMATGQSGHPFSRFYDHLADAWARGDVIPMSMSDDEAQAGGLGTLRLEPQP